MTLSPPYKFIAQQLKTGQVVPFLGSATSAAGVRSSKKRLPVGSALAKELVQGCGNYPGQSRDPLTKVSQFFEATTGRTELYKTLKKRFFDSQKSAALPPVAKFIASIKSPLLVITTNYDPHIEAALHNAKRPFTLVSHVTNQNHPATGSLIISRSRSPGAHTFQVPKLALLDPTKKTVLYKMHGTFSDALSHKEDSLVITENDYADYIATSMPSIPPSILSHLLTRHILFLGYSLEDWNCRVILHRLKRKANHLGHNVAWWGVQRKPSAMEERFWLARGVELFSVDLQQFIRKVSAWL